MQAASATLTDTNNFLEGELAKREAQAAELRAKLHPEVTAAASGGDGRGSQQYETMKGQLQRRFHEKVR